MMHNGLLNVLLNMSITGGLVFSLWYLTYPLLMRVFNASWHYMTLKISILFFLLPLSLTASFSGGVTTALFQNGNVITAETISGANRTGIADFVPILPQEPPDEVPYLFIIWVSGTAVAAALEIYRYYKFKKLIKSFCDNGYSAETEELFLSCKERVGLKRRVRLKVSEYINSPIAYGIINPVVVLPRARMSENEMRLALTHELTHIKNFDMQIKLISVAVSIIHWFNPLTYLLRKRITLIGEYYCDECLVNSMSKSERRAYGNLVIKSVFGVIGEDKTEFFAPLSLSSENTKKRLKNILKYKKPGKRIVALSMAFIILVTGAAASYTIAAGAVDIIKNGESANFENTFQIPAYEINETTIVADLSEPPPQSDTPVMHTIPPGLSAFDKTVRLKEAGESMTVSVYYAPAEARVDIGILEPDGGFRYTNGIPGGTTQTFDIKQSGAHRIFVRNNSNSKVDITWAVVVNGLNLNNVPIADFDGLESSFQIPVKLVENSEQFILGE